MDSTLHERCRLDWEVARWVIEEGIGHGALDHLLAIPGVSARKIRSILSQHKSLDAIPPRAEWHSKKLAFEDRPNDEYNIYYQNPIDAIQSLLGNPVHAKDINRLPVGAALAPVIIATDKMQLTQFSSSKSAYPIYLTLGNIPRAIHRKPFQQACFLLGYLSVDKILKDDLSTGAEGVEITGGDGCVCLIFPVLACYVADYPEQCLVTCLKYGTCPKCQARTDELAELSQSTVQTQTWTMGIIEEAKSSTNTSSAFKTKCMEAGIGGGVFLPFWHGFPHCDIHHSITPDNGWSSLGQIGGKDRKHMAHILLGCMIGKVPRDALQDFHHHKNILFNLGVREHLDIPKIHSLLHYVDFITWFGTTNNYNTEMMEHFHIDFCKEGWHASNHCNEMPQMISWLSRREKASSFKAYLKMTLENEEEEITYSRFKDQNILIAKYPARKNQDIQEIMEKHACPGFQRNLTHFINFFNNNNIAGG
ncbi:hypothetical protein F4604DRAFT_1883139 [Suillus subluteus]|nr:hypothetical protein F4604DRAFT_1883139 [Suillus subluteus]